MFRGTLRLNTLTAVLQMVDAICEAAVLMNDAEISDLAWGDFVTALDAGKYAALVTYLKERRLYVNEPIMDAGEDD